MEIDDMWDDDEDMAPFVKIVPETQPKLRRVGDQMRNALTAAQQRADAAEAEVKRLREAVEKERCIWGAAIETYFDATAVMDVEKHVSAIRAQRE